MLSAETAGQYPSETVAAMAKVCLGAEKMPSINVSRHRLDKIFETTEGRCKCFSNVCCDHMEGVAAIIAMTNSGRTARLMSRISSWIANFLFNNKLRNTL